MVICQQCRSENGVGDELVGTFDSGDFGGTGLTKREQFAAMAMQGMLSNPAIVDSTLSSSYPLIVSKAIIQADMLLEELEHRK